MKNRLIAYSINLAVALFLLLWVNIVNVYVYFYSVVFGLDAGGYEIAFFVLFIITVILFFVPRFKYGMNPGKSVIARMQDKSSSLKSLYFFFYLLVVSIALYFVQIPVADMYFGGMVDEQERHMESKGIKMDWKSYFPDYGYNVEGNGAVYFKKGAELLVDGEAEKINGLWKVLKEGSINLEKLKLELKEIEKKSSGVFAIFEKAARADKFMYVDIKDIEEHKVIDDLEIISFTPYKAYYRYKMIKIVISGIEGRWQEADRGLGEVIKTINLLGEDPTLVSFLIRSAAITGLFESVNIIVEKKGVSDNAGQLYEKIIESVNNNEGGFHEALKFDLVSVGSYLKGVSHNLLPFSERLKSFYFAGGKMDLDKKVTAHIMYIFYRPFQLWDRYVMLKMFEMKINKASKVSYKDRARIDGDEKAFAERYIESHKGWSSAVFSLVVIPQFDSYYYRELRNLMLRDMSRVFIGAHDYKKKYGKVPKSIDEIVKEFGLKTPQNYINGKDIFFEVQKGNIVVISTDIHEDEEIKFKALM